MLVVKLRRLGLLTCPGRHGALAGLPSMEALEIKL